MYKYFHNVKTLDELKAQYRRLAMKHHPDCGGDTATMQAINAEHDALFEILKAQHNAKADADTTGKTYKTTETAEEFRTIITELLKLEGVIVELCGCWLWLSGNTKEHKDRLKGLGCKWSSSKKMWYWRHVIDGYKWHKGNKTMSQIRNKYGSQTFENGNESSNYERIGATA
jgi:curved DNA-binding protein CbpA